MAKDDRFTIIVVVLVTLITAGAFLWSHWGSLANSLHPTVVAAAPATTASPEPARKMSKTEEGNTIVPAVFEVEPEIPDAEPDMVAGVHAWQFADAEYRDLSRAQRHLLLMGRSNATAVRARLEAIQQSLGPTEAIEVGEPVAPVAEPILIAHASQPEPPLGTSVEHLIEP